MRQIAARWRSPSRSRRPLVGINRTITAEGNGVSAMAHTARGRGMAAERMDEWGYSREQPQHEQPQRSPGNVVPNPDRGSRR
jgi:hypothetical protein